MKTGRKYTKVTAAKGSTNMLKKSNASSKLGRTAPKKNDSNMRSTETIKRLKMYTNGKAIRNKEGTIVGGQYMMADRAGDTEITSATGRIAPDRRWFGNTRVVGQTELDKFREEMTTKVSDPYSVVLKRKKLPMGLLQDAVELMKGEGSSIGTGLLTSEPFEHTFGKKSRRKKVKLDQLLISRKSEKKAEVQQTTGGKAEPVSQQPDSDAAGYAALLKVAQASGKTYDDVNNAPGLVPWGRDTNIDAKSGEGIDWRVERKDDLFLKGQSKRIWGEFFKVIDCSDVILHVIDARNVPGTRCKMIENHIAKNASHKHLVFVLNKIDLVPNWVAKRWAGELAAVRPTIAFHASMTHAFGKGALISLLRQFGKLHSDKKHISVGVIGYPNVGKSSVINTLISKKSCKVAPIPGETKIWQYITLFKNIYLIDCPGVVVDTAGDTETDSVLKGVVRPERLENPEDFIPTILANVSREYVAALYRIQKEWGSTTLLLETVARNSGRLLKGGEPDVRSAAIMIIMDYQRGRLPYFVAPPELKSDERLQSGVSIPGIEEVKQDFDDIVPKHEKKEDSEVDVNGIQFKDEHDSNSQNNEDDITRLSTPLVVASWDDDN